MTALLMVLWLAQAGLDIRGESACPTPEEVGQHLAPMVRGEAPPAGEGPHAVVSRYDGYVVVELLGVDGGLVAERRLEQAGSCMELAEAVAVILATWQAKLTPELAPASTAVLTRTPSQAPPTAARTAAPQRQTGDPFSFDAGVGLLTSIAGDAVIGAKVQAALFPVAFPLGLEAAFSVTADHTKAVDDPSAEAKWSRRTLSLGPDLRIGRSPLLLDVHAGGLLAFLHVQGTNLSIPSSDTTALFGLGTGVRGIWAWRFGAAWAASDLLVYPGRDSLTIDTQTSGQPAEVGQLPRFEIQIALGISLGRFR